MPAVSLKEALCIGDLLPMCKIFIERPVLQSHSFIKIPLTFPTPLIKEMKQIHQQLSLAVLISKAILGYISKSTSNLL